MWHALVLLHAVMFLYHLDSVGRRQFVTPHFVFFLTVALSLSGEIPYLFAKVSESIYLPFFVWTVSYLLLEFISLEILSMSDSCASLT